MTYKKVLAKYNDRLYLIYIKKYCVNCQAYDDCDCIPIDANKRIIEDFVHNPEVCSEWMPVEVEE